MGIEKERRNRYGIDVFGLFFGEYDSREDIRFSENKNWLRKSLSPNRDDFCVFFKFTGAIFLFFQNGWSGGRGEGYVKWEDF
ncbi:hypothetical protein DW085_01975 [Clostridium sp. AF50-3]|nr:hypothetical protein DW085_01975 [Clostridium sp. AF50-3]